MKKVLIYGGSGGVGSLTARLLKENQFDVHLVDIMRKKHPR